MRAWVILAAALVLGGAFAFYRIGALEERVDALNRRLGPSSATNNAQDQASAGYEQRLAALEADVKVLREELDALAPEAQVAAAAPAAADPGAKVEGERRILSVVEREQQRVRDRQLEFHRSRWLEFRESALDGFAQQFGLSPWQTEQLHQLLSDEVDKMVDILRKPEALENPEKGVAEWVAMLEATDGAVHRVLDPAQNTAWDQARLMERRVLWPWLPAH